MMESTTQWIVRTILTLENNFAFEPSNMTKLIEGQNR